MRRVGPTGPALRASWGPWTTELSTRVKLSSADRVLFPDDGVTKGDLFDYYEKVAPTLVPHLRDRPFTMKRYPHGIDGEVFFQKQAPKHLPDLDPDATVHDASARE